MCKLKVHILLESFLCPSFSYIFSVYGVLTLPVVWEKARTGLKLKKDILYYR